MNFDEHRLVGQSGVRWHGTSVRYESKTVMLVKTC